MWNFSCDASYVERPFGGNILQLKYIKREYDNANKIQNNYYS